MIIKNINVVTHNETFLADVIIEKDKFKKIVKKSNNLSSSSRYIVPGFIDSHTHGGYGWDFNNITKKDFSNFNKYLSSVLSEGVTTVIGTTVTCLIEDLKNISKNWNDFLLLDKNKIIKGWYIEGPFISKEKKGAHNENFIVPIDLNVLKTISKNNKFIKILAIAPEIKNNISYIKKLSKNFLIAIGHSNATADQTLKAMIEGASRIVHLYNQVSKFDHRNPGIVNAAFLKSNLYCELICDGFHVDPLVLKNTYDIVKPERIIIITDSLSCKGMPNGDYKLGSLSIYKTNDIARLKEDNNIAGSVKPFIDQVKTFINATHCSLSEIVKMTAYNPAVSLGLSSNLGIIKEKYNADFLILDKKLDLLETYKNGKLVYKRKK